MKKKIKAIVLLIWFILSIILEFIISFSYEELLTLATINLCMSLFFILDDSEIRNMQLW